MKSIIWNLYHGNICGKDIRMPEKDRMNKLASYEKLKATLSKESNALFEEFLELSAEAQDNAMLTVYKRASPRECCSLLRLSAKEKNYATESGSYDQRTAKNQSILGGKRFGNAREKINTACAFRRTAKRCSTRRLMTAL